MGDKMSKLAILSEIWEFIKYKKRFWLIPIIIILLLLSILLLITQETALAPFIYALF